MGKVRDDGTVVDLEGRLVGRVAAESILAIQQKMNEELRAKLRADFLEKKQG